VSARRRVALLGALLALATSTACIAPTRKVRDAAPPAARDARRGGTLIVGMTPPGTIEPTNASSPGAQFVVATMCDTLVHIDPETGATKPGLAESWSATRGTSATPARGQTLTFKLRKDLRFHGSGRLLTARDVQFALNRLADPAQGSSMAKLVEPIVGWQRLRDPDARVTRLTGVQVVERFGLQVQLTSGDPDAVRLFAHPATAPIDEHAAEANPLAFARRPSCVGPYQLLPSKNTGPSGAQLIRLVRDPSYAPGALAYTAGGAGYADEIRLRIFGDDDAVLRAWRAGTIDVAWVPSARQLKERDVMRGPSPYVEYLGIPTTTAQNPALEGFDDPRVRVALSMAIDRAGLARLTGAIPATGFVADAVTGRREVRCASARPDVAGARAALARAGVDLRGRRLDLHFNDERGHAAVMRAVAAQLRDAFGVVVVPKPSSWDRFQDVTAAPRGVNGLFRLSWASPLLSTEGTVAAALAVPGRELNVGRFGGTRAARTMYRIEESSGEDRITELARATRYLCEQMPEIPLLFARSSWLVRRSAVAPAREGVIDGSGRLQLRELFVRGAGA
jgi:peptide/nickel transport system substrate-binding protein